MKMKVKKLTALVLALLLIAVMAPVTAFAAETEVDSLEALHTALAGTEDIKLTAQITGEVVVPAGYTGTLDLAGNTILGFVTNKGSLTITDSSGDNSGTISSQTNGKATLLNEGTLKITGGTFTRKQAGEGETLNGYVVDNRNIITEISGGVFTGVPDNYESATFRNFKTISLISGGTFTGRNIAMKVEEDSEITSITGGTFTATLDQGSAVQNYGRVTIDGGDFKATGTDGAAVFSLTYQAFPSEVTINKGTFQGDRAVLARTDWTVNGGTSTATVTINDGTFNGNVEANTENKEGITNTSSVAINVKGGAFNGELVLVQGESANKAEMDVTGGAFQVPGGTVTADKVSVKFALNSVPEETKTLGYAFTDAGLTLGDNLPADKKTGGFALSGWTFKKADGSAVSGTYQTVTAELLRALQTGYNGTDTLTASPVFVSAITIAKPTNGSVTVEKTAPNAGDEVKITATPASGYVLGKLTVKNGGAQLPYTDNKNGTYSFTYPDNGIITIEALFTTGLVIPKAENGSVTVNNTAPKAGDTELSVKDNDDGTFSFTYPEGGLVTIEVQFAPGVSVSKPVNGTVKVNKTLPEAGNTVTVTVTPDKGFKVKGLTVKNGDAALEYTDNKDGTYTFIYPAEGKVNVEAVFESRLPFTDVPADQWYFGAEAFVYDNTLFEGTSSTTFSPGRNMTRAMMVRVLYNMTEGAKKGSSKFDDVPDGEWYSDAISWAAENKIVNGVGGNRFAPLSDITREQMAVMLYNYAKAMKIDLPKTRPTGAFTDAASVSSWAKEAVDAMYAAEVINGVGGNRYNPRGFASRAQVAQMYMNFTEVTGK